MKKIYFILLIFLLAGCSNFQKSPERKFSGTLEITEHSLGAKVPGRLMSIAVEEGGQVKKGQIIATLDRWEQMKKDYERVLKLYEQGGTTAQDVEHGLLAWQDQEILSPIDGIVLVKVYESGEILPAGAPVVVLGEERNLWVRIYVSEGVVNQIRMNQPAVISLDGLDQSFQGHVSYIGSKAEFTPRNVQTKEERVTQMFAVKITLDNPADFLRPGVAADVAL